MESAVRAFVEAIGQRFPGDDLEATPARVARAWADDLLSGYAVDPRRELTFSAVAEGGGLVAVRDISFASVCVHHLLPFAGSAHLAYLPGTRLAGLSKLGRIVDAHARRLQIQERLTADVLATIVDVLQPRGALVTLSASHTCMTLRGARKEASRLVTVAAAGLFEHDLVARGQVLDLLGSQVSRGSADEPSR